MYRGKRLLDLVVVLGAAPLLVFLVAMIALLIRIFLGASVFFVQLRVGLHGKPFRMVKFRTMTEERDPSGALLPDEQRLTRFGRFLRSTSLDELPELLNVLRGDMSLVGPRPLLVEYLSLYSPFHARRHLTLPGLTGLAQVSGRNAISWTERFDLDVQYVQSASIRLDLWILWRTATAVMSRRGITPSVGEIMPKFSGYGPED